MNEIGYLYVIRPAENYAKGEDVFKVGMTIQEVGNSIRRLKGYPKGSEIVTVHQFSADITRELEKKLIAKMAAKYPRCDHGIEYFKVSKIDVIGVFNEIVQEHYKLDASEPSDESEPDESDESDESEPDNNSDNNSDNIDIPDNIADVPDDVKNRVVENIQQQIIGNNNVVNIIHKDDLKCHNCGKKFTYPAELQRHIDRKTPCLIREVPPEQINNPNRCIYCNKIFTSLGNKNKHLKTCKNKNGGINVLDEKVDIEERLIILQQQNRALFERDQKREQEHEKMKREMEVLKKLVTAQMHMD